MIFSPTVISHTIPSVSVTIADESGVTYSQVKNSLGNQVYKMLTMYLYSMNFQQLMNVMLYNRYEVTGDQNYRSIITSVDPYQQVTSLNVDFQKLDYSFIFNGNSSISTVVLPNSLLKLRLGCDRITNAIGLPLNNFKEIEEAFRRKGFFDTEMNATASVGEVSAEKVTSVTSDTVDATTIDTGKYLLLFLAVATLIGVYGFSTKREGQH